MLDGSGARPEYMTGMVPLLELLLEDLALRKGDSLEGAGSLDGCW
jgi:hypothetical protein